MFVFSVFKVVVLSDDGEAFVKFKVPIPEQCAPEWKGEIMAEPNVKVLFLVDLFVSKLEESQISGSSAIQCYCPANGRLLGFVNPSTPDGIDRAIARAKDAQTEWAKTTFKQRRRVLKTILKYFEPCFIWIWEVVS